MVAANNHKIKIKIVVKQINILLLQRQILKTLNNTTHCGITTLFYTNTQKLLIQKYTPKGSTISIYAKS